MITDTGTHARAFNKGSDARLQGRSLSDNPHLPGVPQGRAWRLGWIDVDRWWGSRARGPVKPLPSVYNHAELN